MQTIHQRLAMKLKQYRKVCGLTQTQLAAKVGLSLGYIARLEIGMHDPPLSTLAKLAKALKVTVGELVNIGGVQRIALDTDAINSLVSAGLLDEISAVSKRRGIFFVLTQVTKDQLAQTQDVGRRAQLLAAYEALPKIELPTSGFALGVSWLGHAEMKDSAAELNMFTTKGRGKMQDALIGATAVAKADVLVTDDGPLTRRVKAHAMQCKVWTFKRLVQFLRETED